MDVAHIQFSTPHSLVETLLRRKVRTTADLKDVLPVRKAAPALTIAISREAGTRAVEVARELSANLQWPVLDRELVERVAEDLGLRAQLLEAVDEKGRSWIEETLQGFGGGPAVSGAAYAKHVASTVLALGAQGECILVGRASAQILPAATTLRVRLMAPVKDREAVIAQRFGISGEQARQRVQEIDRERAEFVEGYFHKQVVDPHNYDLILNVARFGVHGSAELIVQALECLRSNVA